MSEMTAAQVLDRLQARWPDSEYLHIREAPQDAMRQGRKIDLLVVSLWRSRGHELDAVEVKVSATDWKRELDNAKKADWWWRHVHRFWVAVPVALAPRVQAELPDGWGLLAVAPETPVKVAVKAAKHSAEPLGWPTVIGLLRAAADSGFGALQRAEQRGYDRGYEAGKRDGKAETSPVHVQRRVDQLTGLLAEYRDLTGIDLLTDTWRHSVRDIGEAVRLLTHYANTPDYLLGRLDDAAQRLTQQASTLSALHGELEATLRPAEASMEASA